MYSVLTCAISLINSVAGSLIALVFSYAFSHVTLLLSPIKQGYLNPIRIVYKYFAQYICELST